MSLSRHLLDPSPNSVPSPSYLPIKVLPTDTLANAPSQLSSEGPLSFEFQSPHSVEGYTPSLALPTAPELWSNRNSNLKLSDLLERVPYGLNSSERFVSPSGKGNEFNSLPSKAQIGIRSRSVREWNPVQGAEPHMLHSRSADDRLPSSSRLEMVSRSELPKSSSQDITKVYMGHQISLKNNSSAVESGSLHSKVRSNSQSSIELRSGSLTGSGRRDPDRRVVYINNPDKTNERYEFSGNTVRTSKYTLLSFVPRNLFEQFHRVAYIYFLIIALLNQLPQLAVFGRTASLFPLIFVLVVTAVKDGFEDWRRHRSDKKENDRLALVAQEGEFMPQKWKHIQVGQMVKVYANETIPCDMVLVATSDENGVAYVQTINLDGESNLKSRYARPETAAKRPDFGPISGRIICEKPNRNIYGFVGYMDFEKQQLPLGPTNVILRGCELKNTSWAVGVVVYAGQETKAMLNSSGAQSKRSRLEQSMNREMLWLSAFLFVMCFVGALGLGLWLKRHKEQLNTLPYYHKYNPSTGKHYNYYGIFGESFFAFLSFVITFQVMIPISLYISLELVRLGQSVFMIRDAEMYHSDSNTRLQCRALSINEDLGQIRYIFSDKTGTLTENKMEFCNASIHGVNYSNAKASVVPSGDVEGFLKQEDKHIIKELLGKQLWKPKVGVKLDPELVRVLQDSCDTWERKAVHDYLLTLAACNTIVPTKVKLTAAGNLEMEAACAGATDDGIGLIEYQGESPDEQALVSAAASYGYTLLERSPNHIVIDVLGKIQRFEILGIHEFDSIRKCMSVVLQCPDRTIKVLVKGADTSVFSKLAQMTEADGETYTEENQQTQLIFVTHAHLDLYARQGLRTLVVAAKDLKGAELENWKSHYAKANTTLHDRGGMLREAAKIVEKGLSLLGATGIEDRLQGGVPETLKALRQAGIKVWVLTGDKQETAISIGISCSLLTTDMHQIIINESERESCREALINAKAAYVPKLDRRRSLLKRKCSVDVTYGENHRDVSTSGELFSASTSLAAVGSPSVDCTPLKRSVPSSTSQPLALIIDGNSLVHALDPDLQQEFYDLASACKAVICCRVAPLQKAGIVSLVKRKAGEMTLAIGDGANDVSMIQTADVGVGISGQEGRQAVLASDFAMGQFKFLKRLLLVHGHWNYSRIGYMVLYNFYRNAVFVMLLFWYIFHNAFSPLSAITDWSLVFYSLIYTAVPTIVVGVLDKDVSHKTLLEYPDLYTVGQRNECYNATLFWFTMLDTLWQSLVLFYVPFFTYQNSTIDIWSIGSIWTIAVVILVNLHLAMDIKHWTWISHAAIWGSIASTYVCLLILDIIQGDDFLPHYWVFFHATRMAGYWLDIILIVCLALLPRFLMQIIRQYFWPSDVQVAREAEILKRNKKREELPVELDIIM